MAARASYTIDTIGALGDPASRFVPVVYLGNGARATPKTPWKARRSLDDARRAVIYMGQVANLAEPMWSGWVVLDGPNEIPPMLRAQHPQGATAWRVW